MTRPSRILFVCTGNVCRSPLAEAILRRKLEERGAAGRFAVDSVGTTADHAGQGADPRMVSVAGRHGVRILHAARRITARDIEGADLIVAMDRSHLAVLQRRAGAGAAARLRLLREFEPGGGDAVPRTESGSAGAPDVPDPWYGGIEGFEMVYTMVERCCERLSQLLTDGGGDDLRQSDH